MAALASTLPTRAGTAVTGAAVAASDTITAAQLGSSGALLEILNGGASPDSVTISDGSATATGAAATAVSATVTNGTNRVFRVLPGMADPVTGLVTVTHSFITSVTYKLYPLG